MIKRRTEHNNIWEYTELDLLKNIQMYLEMDLKRTTIPMYYHIKEVIENAFEPLPIETEQQKDQLVQLFIINCFIHYLESPTIFPYNEVSSREELVKNVKEAIQFGLILESQQELLLELCKNSFSKINQILFLKEDKQRGLVFEKTKKYRKYKEK